MQTTKYGFLIGVLVAGALPSAMAQLEVPGDTLNNCSQIDALRKAGNLTEARDKARLCLDALEQQVTGEVGKQFPADVAGWKRAGLEQGQALGFTNISATYQKGDNTATVSLTGGTGGGDQGLGGLLGGFARAGILGAGQQVRVGGLPASVMPDGTITVTLEDGSFLGFSSPQFDTAESALAGMGDLVNAFPVAAINKMLQ